MADTDTINLAIESFSNWQEPWTFFATVKAHPKCSETDRKAIQVIWLAACDKHLWSGARLQDCTTHTDTALSHQFPWLSPRARQQLINGAAYQWR